MIILSKNAEFTVYLRNIHFFFFFFLIKFSINKRYILAKFTTTYLIKIKITKAMNYGSVLKHF